MTPAASTGAATSTPAVTTPAATSTPAATTPAATSTPAVTTPAATWSAIDAGEYHTVGLKTDGTLWAWGKNDYGALGDGTTVAKTTPTQVGSAITWSKIAAGPFYTLALKTDGTLWAWGSNHFAGLGDGTTGGDDQRYTKLTPIQIGSATTWSAIAAGHHHMFGLKTDGTLWAWGYNAYGQLGDGTTVDKHTPTQIGSATTWSAIATGMFHAVGLKTDGTLWAWGRNRYAQLGDGTTENKHTPTQIGSATWSTIAAGDFHTVGIKTDGTLWAWGFNGRGQLGVGTYEDKATPTQIGSASTWSAIAADGQSTVALKSDGTLWNCGCRHNLSGHLGSATTWSDIAVGGYLGVGLKTDGTLWAWGYNGYGQYGDGTTVTPADSETPTLISTPAVTTPVATAQTTTFEEAYSFVAMPSAGQASTAWDPQIGVRIAISEEVRSRHGQSDFSTTIYKMNDVDWDIPDISNALSLALCSDENCTETQPVTGESRAIYGGIGGQEEGTAVLVDFFPATPLFGGRFYKLTISESAKIVSGATEVSLRELVGLSAVEFSTAEMTRFVLPINLKYDNSNCLGGNVGQFAENTGQPMCRNIEQVAELVYGTAPHQLTHYFDTMSPGKTFAFSPIRDKQGFVRPAIEIDRGKDYEPLGYCFRHAEVDGVIPFASCPNELGDGPTVHQQMAEVFDFDRYRINNEDGTPNVLAPYRPDRESTIEIWANDANRDAFVHRNVTVIYNYGTFQSSALGSASSPSRESDAEFTISNEERPRTWVHELGHALFGLPDLYYHGGVGAATYNVGPVDIMGNNSGEMPPLTAWSLITSELAEPQSLISDLEMSNFINSDGYQLPAQEWSSTAAPAIPAIDAIPSVSYLPEPAFVEMQKHGVDGVSGLASPVSVAVSPDGSHVYVASAGLNSIAVFSRDPDTGALSFVDNYTDGVAGVDGLRDAQSVTVSPDGNYVYVASPGDNAIAVFSRDSDTGALWFVEMHQDGVDGVDGLDDVQSVTVSPDGSHLYTSNGSAFGGRDIDRSVAVFSAVTYPYSCPSGSSISGTVSDSGYANPGVVFSANSNLPDEHNPQAITLQVSLNGTPLENCEIRFEIDEGNGWFFPANGQTNHNGEIHGYWTAGSKIGAQSMSAYITWPNGVKKYFNISGEVTDTSTRTNSIHLNYDPSGEYEKFSIRATPGTGPLATYYSTINLNGAYGGIQFDGDTTRVLFSTWDTDGMDAEIIDFGDCNADFQFGGEGTGVSCRLLFPPSVHGSIPALPDDYMLVAGHVYETSIEISDCGTNCQDYSFNFTDITRGLGPISLGTQRYKSDATNNWASSFVEEWLPHGNCLSAEHSVLYHDVKAMVNGEWEEFNQARFTPNYVPSNNEICANYYAEGTQSGFQLSSGGDRLVGPPMINGDSSFPNYKHIEIIPAATEPSMAATSTPAVTTPASHDGSAWQIGSAMTWSAIAAGNHHTVGLKTDGTLWAWGKNDHGEHGDGTTVSKTTPAQIGSATTWSKIAAGPFYTLALKTDGTLWAWGFNNDGLGDGTTGGADGNKLTPIQIGSATTWSAIAAGHHHMFGLKIDGTLWAWGYNAYGQLGDGTFEDKTTPTQVGSATTWSAIATGVYHAVGLKTDGTLWAWGSNDSGQLGDGTTEDKATPTQIGSATWSAIAAGDHHTVGLKTDGTLWAWGANDFGQLGDGTTEAKTTPTQIGSASTWSAIAADGSDTVALKSDGTLWAWGNVGIGRVGSPNLSGQLGSASTWSAIAVGGYHAVGLKTDGTLWAWGANNFGQLGVRGALNFVGKVDSTSISCVVNAPTQVGSETTWSDIATGNRHTVGLKTDGTLWAWGLNDYGQLGDGTTVTRSTPIQIGSATNWSKIAVGSRYTIALKTDGTLSAWGEIFPGMEAAAGGGNPLLPTTIGGTVPPWSAIAAGGYHAVGLKTDGTLWAWGVNDHGQLGNGELATARGNPIQIGSATTWSAIAAGDHHTVGLKTDGTLWAWGLNDHGQLGDGTTVTRSTPIQIGSATTTWSAIAAGRHHTVGLKTDGTLWAWGTNAQGQLGDPTSIHWRMELTPIQIGLATTWSAIAAARHHTVGLKTDGTLWAWGDIGGGPGSGLTSDYGQIGSATTWSAIAAGSQHMFGLKADGTLWVWGDNATVSFVAPDHCPHLFSGVGDANYSFESNENTFFPNGSVTVSPDGSNVYVVGSQPTPNGSWDRAIGVFSKDSDTGALTLVEVKRNEYADVGGYVELYRLSGLAEIAVSPDGRHLYTASYHDQSIAVFSRDSDTGALSFVETRKDGEAGVDGLGGAFSVTVSPDGSHVYAAGRSDSAIGVFSRDSDTGALTYVGMYKDEVDGVDGLNYVSSVTVSPNSNHVYAASMLDNAIAVFSPYTTEAAPVLLKRAKPAVPEEPASTAYAGCGTTNGKCTIYDNTQPEFKILKLPAIIERDTGEVKGHYLIEFYGTTGYSSEITLAPDTVDFSDQPGAFPGGIAIWKIDNTEQKVKTDICRTYFGHSLDTLVLCDLEMIKQNGNLTHTPEFYPLFPTISSGGGQTTISSFHLFPWWYSTELPFGDDFEQDLSDMPYSIELPVLEIAPYGTSASETTEFGGGSKVAIVTLSFEALVNELKSRIRAANDSDQLSAFQTYETNGSAEFTIQVRKLESPVPMTYADHIRPGQMEFVTGDLADEVLKYGYHIQHR